MSQSKPLPMAAMILDSRTRGYMIGHQVMSKVELQQALAEAEGDQQLTGSLRVMVLDRYKRRIHGQKI